MKTDKSGVWVRCWDGSEMEYEYFSNKCLKGMIKGNLSNHTICVLIQTLLNLEFDKYLDDIRKGSKQLG